MILYDKQLYMWTLVTCNFDTCLHNWGKLWSTICSNLKSHITEKFLDMERGALILSLWKIFSLNIGMKKIAFLSMFCLCALCNGKSSQKPKGKLHILQPLIGRSKIYEIWNLINVWTHLDNTFKVYKFNLKVSPTCGPDQLKFNFP